MTPFDTKRLIGKNGTEAITFQEMALNKIATAIFGWQAVLMM